VSVTAGGTIPAPVTSPIQSGMKPTSSWPPDATTSRYTSAPGTCGKIALRPAGFAAAAKIWAMPM
jgi:hypothetical protein